MTDPADGDRRAAPSDDLTDDLFEGPSDDPSDDQPVDGHDDDAAKGADDDADDAADTAAGSGSPSNETTGATSAPGDGGAGNPEGPPPTRQSGGRDTRHRGSDRPSGPLGWAKWFWTTETGPAMYVRDVLTSVAAVLLVGLLLFAISGIWPPMVAIESGSMEPNMAKGDLVFIVDNQRFTPDEAPSYEGQSTGVVPADRAVETDRTKFGGHGDVIVFMPNGDGGQTPIIHRAILWVDEGEDWYDRADGRYLGNAANCDELDHCPAPNAGFITHGDANPSYDQERSLTGPVKPEWVIGTAEVRVPYLGYVRLAFGQVTPGLESVDTASASPEPSTEASTDTPTDAPASASTHEVTAEPTPAWTPTTRTATSVI